MNLMQIHSEIICMFKIGIQIQNGYQIWIQNISMLLQLIKFCCWLFNQQNYYGYVVKYLFKISFNLSLPHNIENPYADFNQGQRLNIQLFKTFYKGLSIKYFIDSRSMTKSKHQRLRG
ncbi:unnamed protein product [Paramecium primaurelia]|uniref:Uncharacterized protein n=1 Tax=Paramecium primaurelia TaxID=5886 RepID=A0A8S1KTU6_PARPR|nr:unnamed protein product [Paramecium primaurelia]